MSHFIVGTRNQPRAMSCVLHGWGWVHLAFRQADQGIWRDIDDSLRGQHLIAMESDGVLRDWGRCFWRRRAFEQPRG